MVLPDARSPGGHRFGLRIRAKLRNSSTAARRGIGAGVRVGREEQVGSLAVGDLGSLLEGKDSLERRVNNFRTGLQQQQLLEPQRDVQNELRFGETKTLTRQGRARHVPRRSPRGRHRDRAGVQPRTCRSN